jgi:hypothetical protein
LPARRAVAVCLYTVMFGGLAVPVSAEQILFANYGPGNPFISTAGLSFGFDEGEEDTPDRRSSQLTPFVPTATGRLRALEIPLFYDRHVNDGGVLQVNLFGSADGRLPGALLETFTFDTPNNSGEPIVFRSAIAPLLVLGRTYFVEPTTTGQGVGSWLLSPEDTAVHVAVFRNDNGPFERREGLLISDGAMRLSGDVAPIPEPATLTLLCTGLAATCLRARRRKRLA